MATVTVRITASETWRVPADSIGSVTFRGSGGGGGGAAANDSAGDPVNGHQGGATTVPNALFAQGGHGGFSGVSGTRPGGSEDGAAGGAPGTHPSIPRLVGQRGANGSVASGTLSRRNALPGTVINITIGTGGSGGLKIVSSDPDEVNGQDGEDGWVVITYENAEPSTSVTANAGPNRTVASGGTITIGGADTITDGEGDTEIEWSRQSGTGGSLSSTTAASPTFTAPTLAVGAANRVITWRKTVTNNTVSDDDDVTITVTAPTPTVTATITGDTARNTGQTASYSATVTGTATGAISYQWQFRSGTTSAWSNGATTAGYSLTQNTGGTWQVRLRVTRQGVSDTSNVLTTVWTTPLPAAARGTASVSINAISAGNEGATVNLSASLTKGTGVYDNASYAWTADEGTLTGANTATPTWRRPTVTANTNVTLRLVVTLSGTGTTARSGTSVALAEVTRSALVRNVLPAASRGTASVSINAIPAGNEGATVNLSASLTKGTGVYDNASYAWTADEGTLTGANTATPTWRRPTVTSNTNVTLRLVVTLSGTGTTARSGTSVSLGQVTRSALVRELSRRIVGRLSRRVTSSARLSVQQADEIRVTGRHQGPLQTPTPTLTVVERQREAITGRHQSALESPTPRLTGGEPHPVSGRASVGLESNVPPLDDAKPRVVGRADIALQVPQPRLTAIRFAFSELPIEFTLEARLPGINRIGGWFTGIRRVIPPSVLADASITRAQSVSIFPRGTVGLELDIGSDFDPGGDFAPDIVEDAWMRITLADGTVWYDGPLPQGATEPYSIAFPLPPANNPIWASDTLTFRLYAPPVLEGRSQTELESNTPELETFIAVDGSHESALSSSGELLVAEAARVSGRAALPLGGPNPRLNESHRFSGRGSIDLSRAVPTLTVTPPADVDVEGRQNVGLDSEGTLTHVAPDSVSLSGKLAAAMQSTAALHDVPPGDVSVTARLAVALAARATLHADEPGTEQVVGRFSAEVTTRARTLLDVEGASPVPVFGRADIGLTAGTPELDQIAAVRVSAKADIALASVRPTLGVTPPADVDLPQARHETALASNRPTLTIASPEELGVSGRLSTALSSPAVSLRVTEPTGVSVSGQSSTALASNRPALTIASPEELDISGRLSTALSSPAVSLQVTEPTAVAVAGRTPTTGSRRLRVTRRQRGLSATLPGDVPISISRHDTGMESSASLDVATPTGAEVAGRASVALADSASLQVVNPGAVPLTGRLSAAFTDSASMQVENPTAAPVTGRFSAALSAPAVSLQVTEPTAVPFAGESSTALTDSASLQVTNPAAASVSGRLSATLDAQASLQVTEPTAVPFAGKSSTALDAQASLQVAQAATVAISGAITVDADAQASLQVTEPTAVSVSGRSRRLRMTRRQPRLNRVQPGAVSIPGGRIDAALESSASLAVTAPEDVSVSGTIAVSFSAPAPTLSVAAPAALRLAGREEVALAGRPSVTLDVAEPPATHLPSARFAAALDSPAPALQIIPVVRFSGAAPLTLDSAARLSVTEAESLTLAGRASLALTATAQLDATEPEAVAVSARSSLAVSGPNPRLSEEHTLEGRGSVALDAAGTLIEVPPDAVNVAAKASVTLDAEGALSETAPDAVAVSGSSTHPVSGRATVTLDVANPPSVHLPSARFAAALQSPAIALQVEEPTPVAVSAKQEVALTGRPSVQLAVDEAGDVALSGRARLPLSAPSAPLRVVAPQPIRPAGEASIALSAPALTLTVAEPVQVSGRGNVRMRRRQPRLNTVEPGGVSIPGSRLGAALDSSASLAVTEAGRTDFSGRASLALSAAAELGATEPDAVAVSGSSTSAVSGRTSVVLDVENPPAVHLPSARLPVALETPAITLQVVAPGSTAVMGRESIAHDGQAIWLLVQEPEDAPVSARASTALSVSAELSVTAAGDVSVSGRASSALAASAQLGITEPAPVAVSGSLSAALTGRPSVTLDVEVPPAAHLPSARFAAALDSPAVTLTVEPPASVDIAGDTSLALSTVPGQLSVTGAGDVAVSGRGGPALSASAELAATEPDSVAVSGGLSAAVAGRPTVTLDVANPPAVHLPSARLTAALDSPAVTLAVEPPVGGDIAGRAAIVLSAATPQLGVTESGAVAISARSELGLAEGDVAQPQLDVTAPDAVAISGSLTAAVTGRPSVTVDVANPPAVHLPSARLGAVLDSPAITLSVEQSGAVGIAGDATVELSASAQLGVIEEVAISGRSSHALSGRPSVTVDVAMPPSAHLPSARFAAALDSPAITLSVEQSGAVGIAGDAAIELSASAQLGVIEADAVALSGRSTTALSASAELGVIEADAVAISGSLTAALSASARLGVTQTDGVSLSGRSSHALSASAQLGVMEADAVAVSGRLSTALSASAELGVTGAGAVAVSGRLSAALSGRPAVVVDVAMPPSAHLPSARAGILLTDSAELTVSRAPVAGRTGLRQAVITNVFTTLGSELVVGTARLPVKRTNYQPGRNDSQFVVVGVDYGRSRPLYGGSVILNGHIRAAVLVPERAGAGLAFAACTSLDDLLSGIIGGNGKTQVLPSQVETVGGADKTGYFRVDWSAPFMHSEV